jgi:hypothetical protein
VDPQRLPGRLQHDLIAAYLDVYAVPPAGSVAADHARARAIAEAHRDHPVPRWRARFREILEQLDEAEGRPRAGGEAGSLLATEPSLELELEGETVVLQYANLAACEVRWFPMDAELLFSRDPFGEQDTDVFATIRPARTDPLALVASARTASLAVPEEFRGESVLVEVRGAGLVRRAPRYATAMAVEVLQTRGQLRVTRAETGELLPSVYVKVFARRSYGPVSFHKDGYTDLRGRFDYASVSGEGEAPPEDFAILVLSETDGTVIREVEPPAR